VRRLLRERLAISRSDDGMSLVEVVVSLFVFALGIGAIVAMLATSLKTTLTNRQRVAAAQLASKEVEQMRAAVKRGVAIPVGQTITTTQKYHGTSYTLTTVAAWTSLGQVGDACSGALAGSVAYQRIHTQVKWPTMRGTTPVVNDAIITPPPGALSANTISIPVRLIDGKSVPLPGIAVTLQSASGATVASGTTDDNGCAVFAQLTPAVYSLHVNTAGYVDKDGVQNHSQAAGQTTAGTVSMTTIVYDRPGTLIVTPSAVKPLPTAFNYSITQTSWTTNPLTVAGTGATSVSRTVFPFTPSTGSSYGAYPGTCTDSAKAPASTFVDSQGTASVLVPFADITGTFQFKNSSNVVAAAANVAVTAVSSVAACAGTNTYTWTAKTSATGVLDFAIPYGSFVFKVTISGKTYTTPAQSILPGTTTLAVTGT
jgi:Tfp pilus assembly protein PilV